MKKMLLLMPPLFFILAACGSLNSHVYSHMMSTEMRFPKRVLVHRFTAQSEWAGAAVTSRSVELIKDRATEIFTEGLVQMGFDIVDPKTVYNEIKIEDINLAIFEGIKAEEIRKKAEEIRKSLADKFAIEGIFEGSILIAYLKKPPGWVTRGEWGYFPESIEEMGGEKWNSALNMSLTLIPSGYRLWKCNPGQSYFSLTTWEASIERIIKEVLRNLERDIKKIK